MLRAVIALQPGPVLQAGSGFSYGRALLTIFVKMDFGHLPQGGVDDIKDSFCLYRAFVCLCLTVCVSGLQVPVHMLLEFRSHLTCHLVSGASRWPGTCKIQVE